MYFILDESKSSATLRGHNRFMRQRQPTTGSAAVVCLSNEEISVININLYYDVHCITISLF